MEREVKAAKEDHEELERQVQVCVCVCVWLCVSGSSRISYLKKAMKGKNATPSISAERETELLQEVCAT